MYTSGTTGFAKGCLHSHAGWLASAVNFALGQRLAPRSVVYATPPLFHAFGFGLGLSHLVMGGTLVIADIGANDTYWAAVDQYQVNTAPYPRGLPPDERDRPYLRTVFGLAGGFRPEMGQYLQHVLPRADYCGVYGQTEATNIVLVSNKAEETAHPGTLGQPLLSRCHDHPAGRQPALSLARPASWCFAARSCPSDTGTTRRRRRTCSQAAGCTPETWPAATPRGWCTSWTGPRT